MSNNVSKSMLCVGYSQVSLLEGQPPFITENTDKICNTIMEISFFTLAVENLKFNCDQCLRNYHFDRCSQVKKKIPEGQEKE